MVITDQDVFFVTRGGIGAALSRRYHLSGTECDRRTEPAVANAARGAGVRTSSSDQTPDEATRPPLYGKEKKQRVGIGDRRRLD